MCNMNIKTIFFLIAASFSTSLTANHSSRQDYIDTWKHEAMDQMNLYNIPASITLAQAILESQYGNSKLSTEANNHFGIKCHKWTGDTFIQDDDTRNECFRKYNNADESFKDHSEFLKYRSRYANLFTLKISDYKGWAKGLKKSGYATNPKYADLLIDIIEEYKLYQYDTPSKLKPFVVLAIGNKQEKQLIKTKINPKVFNKHQIQTMSNGVRYIVSKKGDTFFKISKEFEIGMWQLYKYNDYGKNKDVLVPGDLVYLQPKRAKVGKKDKKAIVLDENSSLRKLSQKYGVKLSSLQRKNHIERPDETLTSGTKIFLR